MEWGKCLIYFCLVTEYSLFFSPLFKWPVLIQSNKYLLSPCYVRNLESPRKELVFLVIADFVHACVHIPLILPFPEQATGSLLEASVTPWLRACISHRSVLSLCPGRALSAVLLGAVFNCWQTGIRESLPQARQLWGCSHFSEVPVVVSPSCPVSWSIANAM